MANSPQLQRALILHQQARHDLAERELRQHLAECPNDGFALALLAISMLEQERRDEAERTAKESIAAAPDMAYSHYALARVYSDRNCYKEAANAIAEAIRLEPADADYHAMSAVIELERRNWAAALSAAETGLQFDPEHVDCNNFRAMALVKLGRKAEAGVTIAGTLAREPEDALTHANQGWTLLEAGDRKQAMHHFRESLRLDPSDAWAKAGLVEAIKAGNPLYAGMLRYFLWTAKLSSRAQWGVIVGGYVGMRILWWLAKTNPSLEPLLTPIIVAYMVFALLTWLAQPIFNLLLFLHPFGRHALNDDRRSQAKWVGACLALAAGLVLLWFIAGRVDAFLLFAIVLGTLAIPTSAIHACHRGWPRVTMTAITLALGLIGLSAVPFALAFNRGELTYAFLLGVFLSQWVALWLAHQTPKR